MFKSFFNSRATAFVFAAFAFLGATQAQAVQRTHVSAAFGSDANTAINCTAAAPCRFFQAALTVTDNNGEVVVLDSGGYGAVNITQSVALIAPTGLYAGISVFPGANGVTIAAPGVNVVLRGLTINGQGGNYGIFMDAGAGGKLSVENCVVSNMAISGVAAFGGSDILIVDSIFRNNLENGIYLFDGVRGTIMRTIVIANGVTGIRVTSGVVSSTTLVDIAETTVSGTTDGIASGAGSGIYAGSSNSSAIVKVSVRDSSVVRNSQFGIYASGNTTLRASNNSISNNGPGVGATSLAMGLGLVAFSATVIASGNTVTGNSGRGLGNFSGVFESAGNNIVSDNFGGNTVGGITLIVRQF